MIYKAYYQSPIGCLEISSDEDALISILFVKEKVELKNNFIPSTTEKTPEVIQSCILQLEEYFTGKRKEFNLKYKLQGTDFQIDVWSLLEKIPFGKTISYKEQAIQLGNVKAIRAVGTCNGKNPMSIVVPCHRVLGSNGDLTGYAGGMQHKKWLLEHEQKFTASSVIQQKLFELN